MCGVGGGEVHAGGHSYLCDQAPQDGVVQGHGECGDQVKVGILISNTNSGRDGPGATFKLCC